MHYLGNASISNYVCVYEPVNVAGAALIAVAASTVALSLFFACRASWTSSWWKRALSAVVLAGAVSGMHWCAATGTRYRLVNLNNDGRGDSTHSQASRRSTVIVVICLSIGAAAVMAGIAISTARVRRRYAHKAQQVVLAAAVFDGAGRILVSPDGVLPSEKITDTYIERSPSDMFSVAHPLFHWMFRASRDWHGLGGIIGGMAGHVARLPRKERDGGGSGVRLIDDNGDLVPNYDTIFCELFCLAAVNLAEKTKEQLTGVGVLWDEILPTGAGSPQTRRRTICDDESLVRNGSFRRARKLSVDLVEKGEAWAARRQEEYGRGSLMFLVRHVEQAHDVERLEAAGYRFADVRQVSSIISSTMQIKAGGLESKLRSMAAYAGDESVMEAGVHMGFFAVQARVGSVGFSVLVRKAAHNLLPTVNMRLSRLEMWQTDIIRQLDQTKVAALYEKLAALTMSQSLLEKKFAAQLRDAVRDLGDQIEDPIFSEATLTSRVVQVPCRAAADSDSTATCSMITLQVVVPIHAVVDSPKCEFVPLSFFKVHQMVHENSPAVAAFARFVHREMAPIIHGVPVVAVPKPTHQGRGKLGHRLEALRGPLRRLVHHPGTWAPPSETGCHPVTTEPGRARLASRGSRSSNRSTSSLRPYSRDSSSCRGARRTGKPRPKPSIFGGIMVSQEIKVDVREEQALSNFAAEMKCLSETETPMMGSAVVESERALEAATFVDELLAACKQLM